MNEKQLRSMSEVMLLALLIEEEAANQSVLCRQLVGQTVLNRVRIGG